jgi:hypothetical protein
MEQQFHFCTRKKIAQFISIFPILPIMASSAAKCVQFKKGETPMKKFTVREVETLKTTANCYCSCPPVPA